MKAKLTDEKDISIINSNNIWDLTKEIIYSIIENVLFFIDELESDKNEFEEAIFIEDLPDSEEKDFQLNEKENKAVLKEKTITNEINLSNKNSNNEFLNKCATKILKGERLNIEEKKEIIKLHKMNPIFYSIHHLSNLLNLERSTISRWIKKEDEFLTVDNVKKYNLPGQGNKSCIWEKEEELSLNIY